MFASPRGLLAMASPSGHKLINSNIIKAAQRQTFSGHPGSSVGDKTFVSSIPHTTTAQRQTASSFTYTSHRSSWQQGRNFHHHQPVGFERGHRNHGLDSFQTFYTPQWVHSTAFHQPHWSHGAYPNTHNDHRYHVDRSQGKRKYSTSPSEEASESAYRAIDRAANWFCDDGLSDRHFYSTKPFPQQSYNESRRHDDLKDGSSAHHRETTTPEPKQELLQRHWISTNPRKRQGNPKVPASDDDCFSIVSYNILSQKLLEHNSYLYSNCDPKVLEWPFRWTNLRHELEVLNADILCLQEVENWHYNSYIKPWLISRGYHFCYKKRSGHDPSKPDGVLTACKSKKFKITLSSPVEYFRKNEPLAKANNVGLVVMLKMLTMHGKHKNSGNICIGNTHLLYNPKRGDIKLVQLATFFAEINDIMQRHKAKLKVAPSLVLCGDFNSTPDSPLFEFVTKGHLDYEGIEAKHISGQRSKGGRHIALEPNLLPETLQIDNTCSYTTGEEMEEEYTVLEHRLGKLASSVENQPDHATTIQNKGITVDYIFHSQEMASPQTDANAMPVQLKLKGHMSAVTGKDISDINGLPNSKHSSDHLPVVAQFQVLLPSD